jgi:hypothetical protein
VLSPEPPIQATSPKPSLFDRIDKDTRKIKEHLHDDEVALDNENFS